MKARHFILCGVLAVAIWAMLFLLADYERYEKSYKSYPQNYSTIEEFPEKIPEMIRQNYELGDYDILERLIPYSPDVEIVYDGIIAKGPVYAVVSGHITDGDKTQEFALFLEKSLIGGQYRKLYDSFCLTSWTPVRTVSASTEVFRLARVNIFLDVDTGFVYTSLEVSTAGVVRGIVLLAVIFGVCCYVLNRHLAFRRRLKQAEAGMAEGENGLMPEVTEARKQKIKVSLGARHFIICGAVTLAILIPGVLAADYSSFYDKYPEGVYEYIGEDEFQAKAMELSEGMARRYDEPSTITYDGVVGGSAFFKLIKVTMTIGDRYVECFYQMEKPALGKEYVYTSMNDSLSRIGDDNIGFIGGQEMLGFLRADYTYYRDVGELESRYTLTGGTVKLLFAALAVFAAAYIITRAVLKRKIKKSSEIWPRQ